MIFTATVAAIIVNLHARTLSLRVGEEVTHRWPVAIGCLDERGKSHTPKGIFRVIEKSVRNPNVGDRRFGSRVLKTDRTIKGNHVCIHGTNEPELIGQAVSHACIRMKNEDVERLYELVPVGTVVVVE